jgi:hypothetical protein
MRGPVIYRLRGQLRVGRASLLGLVLLIGVAGGAVMASAAAARRTSSAFDRMVTSNQVADALVTAENGNDPRFTEAAVRSLPSVAKAGRIDGAFVIPSRVSSLIDVVEAQVLVIPSEGEMASFDRMKVDQGRMPDQSRPYEVFVQRWWADQHHVGVGDRITVRAVTGKENDQIQSKWDTPGFLPALQHAGRSVSLRIVGVGGGADAVSVDQHYEPLAWVGTRAFWNGYGRPSAGFWGLRVMLRPGATVEDVRRQLASAVPGLAITVQSLAATRAQVAQAVDPHVVALWAFCGICALAGLMVVGQAIGRRTASHAGDNVTLRSMGMSVHERVAAAFGEVVVVGIGGAVVAAAVAVLLSPLGPIGAARLAEPSPGFAVDLVVLGIGAAAVLISTCVLGAWPAWRSGRIPTGPDVPRPSRVALALAAVGASVPSVCGVRFAFEPGTRARPVPTRASLVAAISAVLVVVAVITFATSLDHLVRTPHLYGAPANTLLELSAPGTPPDPAAILAKVDSTLAHDRNVTGWSRMVINELEVNGHGVPTVALLPGPKPVHPAMREGRAPRTSHEIALGATTMSDLHLRLGSTVRLGGGTTARVVGVAVLPVAAQYPGADKAGLGDGGLISASAVRLLGDPYQSANFLVRTTAGTSEALAQRIRRAVPEGINVEVSGLPESPKISALKALRATPAVLGALLVALITTTVVHALVVAVRRRRQDVAIMRTMGLRPNQVVRTSLWQATSIALVAGAIGVPFGIVVGRWTWTILARSLGVFEEPVVPMLVIVAAGVVVLTAANLVGLVPGWRLSRRAPAFALRAE